MNRPTRPILIDLIQGEARDPHVRLAAPVDLAIREGEHFALYGANGSGKSLLAGLLTGERAARGDGPRYDVVTQGGTKRLSQVVRMISFRDVYGGAEPAYYQQRWNCADEQTFPTVREVLERARQAASTTAQEEALTEEWLTHIGVNEHLDKPINLLSSGELRRLQLARTLLTHPRILFVDNPYIGLDAAAREMLTTLLERLSSHLTIGLLVNRPEDIPPFVHRVIHLDRGRIIGETMGAEDMKPATRHRDGLHIASPATRPTPPDRHDAPTLIDLRHITIRYGSRTILSDLNWQVRVGEHWALTGENGAGKSTLLSLLCADNPQSYASDIRLFGHKRGTGESIWDIKRRIGYVSPEIYTTYRKGLPAIDIVASGLHDTIGLYRRTTDEERHRCMDWLVRMGAEGLAERNYLTLSSGEQRLILLLRAFVKEPELLILDEPFHGLDTGHRERARDLIDDYMSDPAKTLIMVTHYPEELPRCIDHHLRLIKQG